MQNTLVRKTASDFNPATGGGDTQFEQSFSNLAHAYVQDSAPTLLDHELGFQLLDKNEDESRAVGVMAFQVGSQLLYSPTFFLNGELKGSELLYIKNQDLFVPLTEGWLKYIINRKPHTSGEGVTPSSTAGRLSYPDIRGLSETPGKAASHILSFAKPFIDKYASLQAMDLDTELAELNRLREGNLSLASHLKVAGADAMRALCEFIENDVNVAEKFGEWYGFECLADNVKRAVDEEYNDQKPSVLDLPDLDLPSPLFEPDNVDVYLNTDDLPDNATEPELEYFYSHSILVRDHRRAEQKSVVADDTMDEDITSPSESGIYPVVTRNGDLEHKVLLLKPTTLLGTSGGITILSTKSGGGTRDCKYVEADQLFVSLRDNENAVQAYKDWFDKLSVASPSSDNHYVIVDVRGRSTCPVRLGKSMGTNASGEKMYAVETPGGSYGGNLYTGGAKQDTAVANRFNTAEDWSYRNSLANNVLIISPVEGSRIHLANGALRVPSSAKFIQVDADRDFLPGGLQDVARKMRQSLVRVKLARDAGRFLINERPVRSKQSAVKALIMQYDLDEVSATEQVAKAADGSPASGRYVHTFHTVLPAIKQAYSSMIAGPDASYGMDMQDETPGENFMGFRGDVAPNREITRVVEQLAARNSGSNRHPNYPMVDADYDSQGTFQQGREDLRTYVSQAAQRGDKDVFDIGMLSGMLKTVKDDLLVDKHIPALMEAQDRLGRLLFLFYWHYDKFSARFGKNDMPELEDSLRNCFEMVGDVILFLKNKTVDALGEGVDGGASLHASSTGT